MTVNFFFCDSDHSELLSSRVDLTKVYKQLMEPDSQWFMVTGQEAMGTSWNTGNSVNLFNTHRHTLFYSEDGQTVEQMEQVA